MRPSQSGFFRPRQPWADKRLLVGALFIACACVGSYLAGLHATCKLTGSHTGMMQVSDVGRTPAGSHTAHQGVLSAGQRADLDHNSSAHVPVGRHIMLEYYNVPRHLFAAVADTDALQHTISSLITQAGMTFLGHSCHVFPSKQGVTCVFLLSESHLSIHTWPEHGYAALDIYTCGVSAHPEVAEQGLQELLQPGLVVRQEQARGGLDVNKLSPEQRQAKVLHTFTTSSQDGESLQQQLYQVPVLHSSLSHYQSIKVIEAPGQLGRCLLLDDVIQFCSHDVDAYTDHMARHPLQLLQALHGCGTAANQGVNTTATEADAPSLAMPDLPPAGSSSNPGHVTCRTSLLQPPGAGHTTAMHECRHAQQRKMRVLLVGGGDGWIAGHLISCYGGLVDSVTAIELDKAVSDVTENYFGHMMSHGSPFSNPRIRWEYTDAFAWVMSKAAQCSGSSGGVSATASNNSGPTQTGSVAGEKRMVRRRTSSLRDVTSNGSSSNNPSDCAMFDFVIIDSTDFTVAAASKLHSAPFYRALYQLMRPQAALIQIVEIYLRVFENSFAAMEGALRQGGWSGVGRSSVYTPSYGGEALMLHGVKR